MTNNDERYAIREPERPLDSTHFFGSIDDKIIGGDWSGPSVNPTPARQPLGSEAGSVPEVGVDDSVVRGTANPCLTAMSREGVPLATSPQPPLAGGNCNMFIDGKQCTTRRSQGARRRRRYTLFLPT